MASIYHICGYHNNCLKSAGAWCQYQNDKQDNTNYYKSKADLPIDVRRPILPIYQPLCKSEMLVKCLHGKIQDGSESFNKMIWNRVPKATYVRLDALSAGVYDTIAHFKNGEKAALDIMELLKIDPGYMTKCCKTVNIHRKRSFIYGMSEPQKKLRKVMRYSKKSNKTRTLKQKEPHMKRGDFKFQY